MSAGRLGSGKRGGKRSTSWVKGQSGNPNGRMPDAELAEVRKLTKDIFEPHVSTAVAALVRICTSGKSEAAVVAAAEKIIDRARGKAPVTVEDGDSGSMAVFEFVLRKPGNDDKPKDEQDPED